MDYLFIVNTQSQSVKTKGSVLSKVNGSGQAHIELLDGFDAMPRIVELARSEGCPWVIIEGGDGTAHGVMTAFLSRKSAFESFPKFTVLPGGMTNQVARNIGLKRNTVKDVEALLNRGPNIVRTLPILALDIQGAQEKFGFLFSTGGIPTATEYCKTKMHGRGIGGAAAVAATILRGVAGSKAARDDMMPATELSLEVKSGARSSRLSGPHLATIVTTLPGVMLNIDPFWGQETGNLRLTYASAGTRHMLRNMLSIWMGNKSKDRSADGFQSFNASELRYTYDGPVVLDGETIDAPQAQIIVRASAPIAFAA